MLACRLGFGALLVLAAPAAADDIRPDSTITSVVVYPQGASVVRSAEVDLPRGDSVVIIGDLPISVEADSLKVDGGANGAIAIGSVETRYVPAGDNSNPERDVLLAAIQMVEDKIRAAQDRIGALDGRRRFLERLIETTPAGFGAALSEGAGAIDQWATAAVTIGDGLAATARETQAAHIELRTLNEELEKQRKALAELPQPRDSIEVRVSLNAETAVQGTLNLSYRTPDAYWAPTYDAQLSTGEDGAGPSLTIVRRAEVTQVTGEDWTNVALTLSTTRTAGGTAAPYLAPNLISLYDGYDIFAHDAEASVATSRPLPAPSLMGAGSAAGVASQEAAKYVEAAASFGDFRAEYVVPGRVSVDSGEGARSLRIATEEMIARLRYGRCRCCRRQPTCMRPSCLRRARAAPGRFRCSATARSSATATCRWAAPGASSTSASASMTACASRA